MMCIFQVLRSPQDLLLELEDQQGSHCSAVRPESEINIGSLGVNFISLLQGCHFSHILEKSVNSPSIGINITNVFLSLLTESDAGNHVATTFSNGG